MKTYFWTVYSLGLRLNEGLHLQVGDIDAPRGMVHVHAPQYLRELEQSEANIQIRRVRQAIMQCRTGALGGVKWGCTRCGHTHWTGRSCGNRHCATCGSHKTEAWLDKQSRKLLVGVHHFMVTFTVSQELRAVLRVDRRAGNEALMRASSSAMIEHLAAIHCSSIIPR